MRRILIWMLVVLLGTPYVVCALDSENQQGYGPRPSPIPPPWTRKPLIQVAFILDAGPGMTGLIRQAQAGIWTIVNELMFTIKHDKSPIVQLALLTDGLDAHSGSQAGNRIHTPFTTNYDAIFQRLDSLKTGRSGSSDRADAVRMSLRHLRWSPYPEDVKVLFVVGDDWFNRSIDGIATACSEAISAGVVINTLYCGVSKLGLQKHWGEAAYCTGGYYLGIQSRQRLPYIKTEVDRRLLALNEQLHETYRLSADRWNRLWKQQQDQDRRVARVSKEARLQRVVTNAAKGLLLNATDAMVYGQTGTWGLEPDIPPERLPLLRTERDFHQVVEQAQSRRDIEAEILELAAQRLAFLEARRTRSSNTRPTFSQAVISILQEQIQSQGFQLVSPEGFVRSGGEG